MTSEIETRIARRELINTVKIGDLVRVNGTLRIVRDLGIRNGKVHFLTLSILRCIWTRRPFTVYNKYDLSANPFEVVKRGYGVPDTSLDRILTKHIEDSTVRDLECCDVMGVLF